MLINLNKLEIKEFLIFNHRFKKNTLNLFLEVTLRLFLLNEVEMIFKGVLPRLFIFAKGGSWYRDRMNISKISKMNSKASERRCITENEKL